MDTKKIVLGSILICILVAVFAAPSEIIITAEEWGNPGAPAIVISPAGGTSEVYIEKPELGNDQTVKMLEEVEFKAGSFKAASAWVWSCLTPTNCQILTPNAAQTNIIFKEEGTARVTVTATYTDRSENNASININVINPAKNPIINSVEPTGNILIDKGAIKVDFDYARGDDYADLEIWSLTETEKAQIQGTAKETFKNSNRNLQFIFKQPYVSKTVITLLTAEYGGTNEATKTANQTAWGGLKLSDYGNYIDKKPDKAQRSFYVMIETNKKPAFAEWHDSAVWKINLFLKEEDAGPVAPTSLAFTEIQDMKDSTLIVGITGKTDYEFALPKAFKLKIENVDKTKNLWLSTTNDCDYVQNEVTVANFTGEDTIKDYGEKAGEVVGTGGRWAGVATGKVVKGIWKVAGGFFTGFWEGLTGSTPEAASVKEVGELQVAQVEETTASGETENTDEMSLNEKNNIVTGKYYPVPKGTLSASVAYWRIEKIDGTEVKDLQGKEVTFYACQKTDSGVPAQAKIKIKFGESPQADCTTIVSCLKKIDQWLMEGITGLKKKAYLNPVLRK